MSELDEYDEIITNTNDIRMGLFARCYGVTFPGIDGKEFFSAADCESDAIDEAIDWLEEHAKDDLALVILTDEEAQEAELDELEYGGNKSYPLRDSYDIQVVKIRRQKLIDMILERLLEE